MDLMNILITYQILHLITEKITQWIKAMKYRRRYTDVDLDLYYRMRVPSKVIQDILGFF